MVKSDLLSLLQGHSMSVALKRGQPLYNATFSWPYQRRDTTVYPFLNAAFVRRPIRVPLFYLHNLLFVNFFWS